MTSCTPPSVICLMLAGRIWVTDLDHFHPLVLIVEAYFCIYKSGSRKAEPPADALCVRRPHE